MFGPTNAIDTGKMLPISRLGGIGYGRTTDVFGRLNRKCLDSGARGGTDFFVDHTESMRPSWAEHVKKTASAEEQVKAPNGHM